MPKPLKIVNSIWPDCGTLLSFQPYVLSSAPYTLLKTCIQKIYNHGTDKKIIRNSLDNIGTVGCLLLHREIWFSKATNRPSGRSGLRANYRLHPYADYLDRTWSIRIFCVERRIPRGQNVIFQAELQQDRAFFIF